MLPISEVSQEQRETKYRADVDQLNEDRRRRGLANLEVTLQETRNQWQGTPVTNHERSLPFSDSLTTLMFVVASDLSDNQREGLTRTLSLRGMSVPACTLEVVRTVFMDFCCTPKCSMEKLSLRPSGH